MKKVALASVIYFVLLTFFTSWSVLAEDGDEKKLNTEIELAEKDILFENLQALVGQSANIIVGGDTPEEPDHIIAVLSKTFNNGILTIAIIFMIIKGVWWLATLNPDKAREQTVNFGSAPIAAFISVILLMPLDNGYSILQHVVIKAGGYGISLSNKMTYEAADFLDKRGSYNVSPAALNIEKSIAAMLQMEVCAALYEQQYATPNVNNTTIDKQVDWANEEDYFILRYDGLYNNVSALAFNATIFWCYTQSYSTTRCCLWFTAF